MVKRSPCRLLLASLALLTSCSGAPEPEPAGSRNVLLISVDALYADHVGLYGYPRATTPNLDRWFANAAVYPRAYSTEANTSPAVISMLSGKLPQDHRVRLLCQLVPEETHLLPDLLPDEYVTAAFVSNVVLTDEAMGIAKRFDHYDDFVDQREPYRKIFERNARRTTDAVLRWLREDRDHGRPLFLWVHYIDPHGPYHPPEDWTRRFQHDEPAPFDLKRMRRFMREPGINDGLEYVDRYDEEIAYTDQQIGRLLRGYADLEPIDDTLLVFTADHGEAMMEHEIFFTHGYHVYEPIIRVPLMIRGPGVASSLFPSLVSGVDLVPTILRFTGAPGDPSLPGVDLLGEDFGDRERTVFAEATWAGKQWRTAISSERKWVVRLNREGGLNETRFFDLARDPGEVAPGEWEYSQVSGKLLDLCRSDPDPGGYPEESLLGTMIDAPKVSSRADAEQLEKLRALGYVE